MNQYRRIFTVYLLLWLILALAPAVYAVWTMPGHKTLERLTNALFVWK